jgi:hypothetical protein
MAAEATRPDGTVDLTTFPTYNELDAKLMGRRTFPGQTHLNTNAHHLARKDFSRAFGIPENQWDNTPAALLPKDAHGRFEYDILQPLLPVKKAGQAPYGPADRALILQRLEEAYIDFGRPELFPLARQWLLQGAQP